ncbi:YqjK family protein [Noviherbaspirillum galbum]|uniref:YqjK-like protein n=1 Tax=Noviherbaspirillum galbum TaxID=2709383 RepID=A0A6B3SUX0_9BURK|nr:YqjK-like family protein [Noviherbaspirillum galbum]NEX61439.1 hypothetical protein [Noviherbaspirillum galbum]
MNERALYLARKRQMLLVECAMQREDLLQQAVPLAYTLQAAETGVRIVDRVRRHPGWIAAAVAGLAIIRPKRLSAALRLGTTGLRAWRQWSPAVMRIVGEAQRRLE